MPDDKVTVGFTVTKKEREVLRRAAKASERKLADWLRRVALIGARTLIGPATSTTRE